MTHRGYVARLLCLYLPTLVSCVLLAVVSACGTGDSAVSGVETPDPTATVEIEDNAAVVGDMIILTPTVEVEDDSDSAASGVTPVPTPTAENIYQPVNDVSAFASDTPTAEADSSAGYDVYISGEWLVPPSLDEQIFMSDTIVRATLKSATSTTVTAPSEGDGSVSYLSVHELRFTVHEYLKGSGPSEILVVARGGDYGNEAYATVAKAREAADWTMSQRTTTWDDRQGVLFLMTLDGRAFWDGTPSPYHTQYVPTTPGGGSASSATTTAFAIYTGAPYEEWWVYTVDTLSRGWLPMGSAPAGGSPDNASGAASVSFIEDGSKTPYSTVTLGEIRTKITEMAATLKAGEGIARYRECVHHKIGRERMRRAYPWTPKQYEATLASGLAAGTEAYRRRDGGEPKHPLFYVTGTDKDYFQAPIVDEDSDPYNGFFRTLSTTRPLLAGTYSVKHNVQDYGQVPCNFKPDDAYSEWTVTVTAPSGTVHEAFFDPASTFLGVGASGGAGVISPASFNVGGATTTITRIVVSFGSMVSMQISPSVSLSGKHVEFIKVDGTVAARLSFDKGDLGGGIGIDGAGAGNGTSTAESAVSAQAQAQIAAALAEAQATGSKMYFWFVSSAPWKAGDKLMLRIR